MPLQPLGTTGYRSRKGGADFFPRRHGTRRGLHRERPAWALPQISERRMNRRVPSVYRGLSGTKRERPISKGFLHCGMVHSFNENRTRISLKSLAIPAGFEPATHGVEIRHFYRCRIPCRRPRAFRWFDCQHRITNAQACLKSAIKLFGKD